MKRLIAFMFCLAVLATFAHAEYPQNGETQKVYTPKARLVSEMGYKLDQKVKVAQKSVQPKPAAPVQIKGEKRLVSVILEVPEHFAEGDTQYHYWYCPAVLFNKDGALAFDGECWKAFEKASKLSVGRTVNFVVNLSKLGKYTKKSGEKQAGKDFYFSAVYVADEGNEYTRSVNEAFRLSPDHAYIVYKLSLFNDPKNENNVNNSEVQHAIAQYYKDNALKEVNAETMSTYFKQKHPGNKVTDGPAMFHPEYD